MRKRLTVWSSLLAATLVFAVIAFSSDDRPGAVAEGTTPAERMAQFQPKKGTSLVPRRAVRVDGNTWELGSFTNSKGEFCSSETIPGEGTARSCGDLAKMFAGGRPVYAVYGGRQDSSGVPTVEWDNLWVSGFAKPVVATLELITLDCTTQPLAMDAGGAFLHVVGPDEIKQGKAPYEIVARGATGAEIYRQSVQTGLPRNAVEAGLEQPQPGAACQR